MRLAGGDGQDGIPDDAVFTDQHRALVAGQQAVAKHAVAPGKLVAASLDVRDHRKIAVIMLANDGRRVPPSAMITRCLRPRHGEPGTGHPGFTFLRRAAQQVRGVVGHDQRYSVEIMCLFAHPSDRIIAAQQVLRGNLADRQDDFRLHEVDLALQIAAGTRPLRRASDRDCPADGTSGYWQ